MQPRFFPLILRDGRGRQQLSCNRRHVPPNPIAVSTRALGTDGATAQHVPPIDPTVAAHNRCGLQGNTHTRANPHATYLAPAVGGQAGPGDWRTAPRACRRMQPSRALSKTLVPTCALATGAHPRSVSRRPCQCPLFRAAFQSLSW